MTEQGAWAIVAAGGVGSAVLLGLAIRAGRRLRFLTDTPTSKARGVFIGQVELAGRAVTDQPVRSYLANVDSVWFRFRIEEEWERWETETTTNSKGETVSRQVRRTGWSEIASGGEAPPFFVEDETGAVRVRPEGADIEPVGVFSETVGRGDTLYFGKGPPGEIADSNHRRRFTESAIPCGTALFVAGHAREREDVVAPEIAADPHADLFLISCRGEATVQRRYRLQFWLLGLLALAPLPLAEWFFAHHAAAPVRSWLLVGTAVAVAAIWAGAWLWMTFNSLVQLRHRAEQAWSLVDVQLKRRADLIPSLLAVVTGLRDHEQNLQTEVAALRAQATATPPWEPGADVAGARVTVRAVAERYPELKANAAFLNLQRELGDTESRIALARDYYNEIATAQNTRFEIVPDRWIAPLARLARRPLLGAADFERAATPVRMAPEN